MRRLLLSLLLSLATLSGLAEAITVGEPATFRANSDGASSYQWVFPGNVTKNGATVQHTFDESGSFAVTLKVTGTDGQTNQVTKNVTIENGDRPTAIIETLVDGKTQNSRDIKVTTKNSISIKANFGAQNKSSLDHFWTINGQRQSGTSLNSSDFDKVGFYQVSLTVFDAKQTHLRDQSQVRIIVENQGPEIQSMSVSADKDGQVVRVRAQADDPDGNIESYRFEVLENGRSILSQLVTKPEANFNLSQYPGAHTYDFRVTVADDRQRTSQYDHDQSLTIENEVTNEAPELSLVVAPGNEGVINEWFNFLADATDSDGDALRYQWIFPDGQQYFSSQVRYRFLKGGEQTVVVRVSDGIETIEDSIVVNVTDLPNAAPEVKIMSSLPANNGDTNTLFRINALGTDADRDNLTYTWEMGDGGAAISNSPLYRYDSPGTYTATVTVTDGKEEASDSISLQVVEAPTPIGRDPENNNAPEVSIAALPNTGSTADNFRFTSQISDLDSDPLTYTWEMGDGIRYFTPQASHYFRQTGTYEVSLTVSDGLVETTATTTVTVGESDTPQTDNQTPQVRVLSVSPQLSGTTETIFRFYTQGQDADGDQLQYEWDMGDGQKMFIQNPAYRFYEAGQYQVSVRASDGIAEATDQVIISVEDADLHGSADDPDAENRPPTLSITAVAPSTTGSPQTLFRFFTQVNDPDADDLIFTWEMGDGNTMSGQNPIYRYESPGTYLVIATVNDGTDEVSSEITITVVEEELVLNNPENNQAPTINLTAQPLIGDLETSFLLTANAIDPDEDNILYNWEMGDGSRYFTSTVQHQYTQAGQYSINLQASDGLGSSIAETSLLVTQAPLADDTDGDGVPDAVEEENGTDPNDPNNFLDENNNGIPDYAEEQADNTRFSLGAIDQIEFSASSCEKFQSRLTVADQNIDLDYTAAQIALREYIAQNPEAKDPQTQLRFVEKWKAQAQAAYLPLKVLEPNVRAADWQALVTAGLDPEGDLKTAHTKILGQLKAPLTKYKSSTDTAERAQLKSTISQKLKLRELINTEYNLSEDKPTLTQKKARLSSLKSKWEDKLDFTVDPADEAKLERDIANTTRLLDMIARIEVTTNDYFVQNAEMELARCQINKSLETQNTQQLINATADIEGTVDTTFFLYAKAFAAYQQNALLFEWDLDDGRQSGGQNIFFKYPRPGLYEVTLSISDELTSSQDRLRIRVYETWPEDK